MYFTRGAKVRTRRSRTARSLVRRYSFQSASVSSEERRRLEVWAGARLIRLAPWCGGTQEVSGRARTFRIPGSGTRGVDMWPDVDSPVLGRSPGEAAATALK